MSFNLPNPSLFGILLVISTHSGPLLVFKYPKDLSEDSEANESSDDEKQQQQQQSQFDDKDDYNEMFENEDYFNDDDDDENQFKFSRWDSKVMNYSMGTKKDLLLYLDDQETSRRMYNDQYYRNKNNNKNDKNDKINDRNSSKKCQKSRNSGGSDSGTILGIEPAYLSEMLAPPKSMCNSRFEITIDDRIFLGFPIHKLDNGAWRPVKQKSQNKHLKDQSETPGPISKFNLNMFHLVFILKPPVIECNYRIDEMFHYVISRLSLVLRYEQLKYDYVSDQVKLIMSLKEENVSNLSSKQDVNQDLHSILLEKSSLCKLISDCYTAISHSQIANLSINNKLRSFQIPIKTEFHSLPESLVPYLPGSHLSSTTMLLLNSGLINVGQTSRYGQTTIALELDNGSNSFDDVIHFTLLLLDDPDTIIRDVKAEPDSAFAKFIRLINPTESILKLANNNGKDLVEIKSFVYHLVYWRRARVIQPINTRAVYIVSPMAPIQLNLFDDIIKFRETFPTLPSLTHFLKQLSPQSRKPQQFATIIPSRDHRNSYLEALAWLLCHGYVTQLQTFIWLKISPKIKLKVEEDLENEATQTQSKKRTQTSKISTVGGTDNTSKKTQGISGTYEKLTNHDKDSIENLQKRLTAIGPNVTFGEEDDTIILDPGRATTLERKWINRIIFEECKLSQELIAIFYKLLKYMNGKSSLEFLLLKENISRNELRKLLFAIEDHIITVRHW